MVTKNISYHIIHLWRLTLRAEYIQKYISFLCDPYVKGSYISLWILFTNLQRYWSEQARKRCHPGNLCKHWMLVLSWRQICPTLQVRFWEYNTTNANWQRKYIQLFLTQSRKIKLFEPSQGIFIYITKSTLKVVSEAIFPTI